jgi:hypothetical protein
MSLIKKTKFFPVFCIILVFVFSTLNLLWVNAQTVAVSVDSDLLVDATRTVITQESKDSPNISLRIKNSAGADLNYDFYKVELVSSTGTLSPITRDGITGSYSSKLDLAAGQKADISGTVTYNRYICNNVEIAKSQFGEVEKSFYDQSGMSLVNTRYLLNMLGLTGTDAIDYIAREVDKMDGLEYQEELQYAQKFFELTNTLVCQSKEEKLILKPLSILVPSVSVSSSPASSSNSVASLFTSSSSSSSASNAAVTYLPRIMTPRTGSNDDNQKGVQKESFDKTIAYALSFAISLLVMSFSYIFYKNSKKRLN